jgi:subtilisin inhibitor-like
MVVIVIVGGTGSITAAQAMSTVQWSAEGVASQPRSQPIAAKTADLTIVYRAAPGQSPTTMALHCNPPGGNQPRAAEACGTLAAVDADGLDPFAAPRPEQICTVGYGGPQTAMVRGTWGLRHVEARFARTNGCQIARWNLIAPVLEPASR